MQTDPWGHEGPPAVTATGAPVPTRLAVFAVPDTFGSRAAERSWHEEGGV